MGYLAIRRLAAGLRSGPRGAIPRCIPGKAAGFVLRNTGPTFMKFFVDTAEVAEIRALTELGMVDGVTTNPSLIAKSGRDMKQVIAEICAITPGPVSAEVTATDAAGTSCAALRPMLP
jgi:hypothetical protein